MLWPLFFLFSLAILVQLLLVDFALARLGLSPDLTALLVVVSLLGSAINLPLYEVAAEAQPDFKSLEQRLQELFGWPEATFAGRTTVAVNVGGAVLPVLFSLYLLQHSAPDLLQVIAVIAVVAAIAYLTSEPIPEIGVSMPILVAPLTAALAASLINLRYAAPLAYIGATLGVLIGADLLRLRSIPKLGATVAAIGGAGPFDGIYLSGLLAVLLV